jgi:alkanesulfonate monooxygenase SsuD/methylene tetrahydromethanopterin reductase-like flavin-dependent oxidoreductase (luciferase family)
MLPVGYLPCTQDPPDGRNMARVLDEIMAEAQAAEASGWNGCFITEHHQQRTVIYPTPADGRSGGNENTTYKGRHLCVVAPATSSGARSRGLRDG